MAVKAGFKGSLTLNINAAGALAMGVRKVDHSEDIEIHDTSSTVSPVTNNVLQSTCIQGKTTGKLQVDAQYSAGGAGDPPAFGGGNLYGNIPMSCVAGDTIAGNYVVTNYTNSFDVDGTIDYSLSMQNNGSITRTAGT